MPRLFITPREVDFFNDISKEVTKDIIGQKIYYFPMSFDKTKIHDIYEEAPEKIAEQSIEINCIVEWEASEVKTTKFGQDAIRKIKVHISSRDLINKDIVMKAGSFFTFGAELYEITYAQPARIIYGQIEYSSGVELKAHQVRRDNFAVTPPGPTGEQYSDEDAVQKNFYQQRGFEENREGQTGDRRDLIDKGVLDKPEIDEPAEVSGRGTKRKIGSGFYGDGDDENSEF
jgi:hypothetical protein